MSGHSRPSGGPSQRLDTRRSQIRGIVDEPQNCRLKAKIIETQSGERPQWTENQKEGRPRQRETLERGISIGFDTEKIKETLTCRERQRDTERNSKIQRKKQRCRESRKQRNTERPVPTHSQSWRQR